MEDERTRAGRTRQHPAVDAQALRRVEVEQGGGVQRLALRLAERLALFQRRDPRELIRPLADQRGRLDQQRPARLGRGRAPRLEPALRRLQRCVQIGGRGER